MDPIRAASIRVLYQTMRISGISGTIVTLTMIGTAWPFTSGWVIAGWAIVQTFTQLFRELLVRAWRSRVPPEAEYERWATVHVVYMFFTGIVWGATIFLFAHPEEPTTVALTLCCLFGISSGSVASQAPNPPSLYAMIAPIFVAVVVRLFATGDFAYILLALASAGFSMMMARFCRDQSLTIASSIRIRFENSALLEQLTIEKAAADKARQAAESASLAKSQFIAAASHDLRQPLYALSLFSASLSSLKLDADGHTVVSNIQESIAAMESLFVGLLDVSRLDAGVVKPRFEPVSVDSLFDRLSQYFHPVAIERGLDLRFRSDGEWVTSDVTLLEQVLSNLVSNALRCTRRGAVLMAARRRGGNIQFEVWDTGIGIEESDRQRIFEEFVQLDNPERDRRKGLGLGLSIAQRSALLIGGPIALSSQFGRGSRFVMTQPSAKPPAPLAAGPGIGAAALALPGDLPLLIVDDDRDVRNALSDLLSRWSVRFETAVDAADALGRLAAGARYRLVLADYRLPGGYNGLDLISTILKQHPKPSPACALITGDFDPGLIAAAHAQGVPLFHKPLKPARLRTLLGLSEVPAI